ncbi:hypothetical protein NOVO_09310 (plasmid) [Rickettsiales bacterium Ac37b]|nr:hypothetical protein NOVO_09310 [Rickettsiales bacterium Ac37b]
MSCILCLGQLMHYIQAYKIFTNKSATDVSLLAYMICTILLLHWFCYGLLIKNRVVIVAEGLGLFGAILVVAGVLIYG